MAEPTKLTQAQTLFAVLAGAAQSRRERVYYRDGVLRSTIYSPIPLEVEYAANTAALEIVYTPIVTVPLDFVDLATNAASLAVVKTVAAKPEALDFAANSASFVVSAFIKRTISANDAAQNNSSFNVIKYDAPLAQADDSALNNATLTVVKL